MNQKTATYISAAEENIHYMFSAETAPVARVKNGAHLVFETRDASNGMINGSGEIHLDDGMRKNFLPLTGPVLIEDCHPGDVLRVDVIRISVAESGHLWSRPGNGVLSLSECAYSQQANVRDDVVSITLADQKVLRFPTNKMVGIMGVAPKSGVEVKGNTPGSHGGNMDTVFLAEGCSAFFPVEMEGALLSMGDLHAAMGEGELCGTGIEIAGEVECKIYVEHDFPLSCPCISQDGAITLIASGADFRGLVQSLTKQGSEYYASRLGISEKEAYLVVSAVGDIRVAQVVNPLLTLSLTLPEMVVENKRTEDQK